MKHYKIELARAEAVYTAVVRGQVAARELSRFVPAACGEVWSFARAAGLPRPGRNLALYLADGAVEAGVEMTEKFTGNSRVVCSQLPAGRVAHTIHFGPYQGLSEAHAAFEIGAPSRSIGSWASPGSSMVTGRRAGILSRRRSGRMCFICWKKKTAEGTISRSWLNVKKHFDFQSGNRRAILCRNR